MDVHLPSLGWSPTIKNRVANLPKDGHPFSKEWSPTISKMVKQHPQDCQTPSPGWSTTIPWMVNTFTTTVTQHFQDGQLDLEFDFRTAQLVDSRNLPSKFGQNWVINS